MRLTLNCDTILIMKIKFEMQIFNFYLIDFGILDLIEKCKAKGNRTEKGQKFHQIDQVLFKNTITSFIILLPENLNKIKFVFIFLLGFKKSIKNMVYYTMLYHSNKNKISRILKIKLESNFEYHYYYYFTFFSTLFFSNSSHSHRQCLHTRLQ